MEICHYYIAKKLKEKIKNMEENFDKQSQPSIMVPVGDLDKVEHDPNDVDTLAQELATIRQSAKKSQLSVQEI